MQPLSAFADPSVAMAFVRDNTELVAPPLVPELRLHLATEITPLWQATEDVLASTGLPPPYWAFAWPGGQAMARLLLDRPDLVRGRRIVDFAAGCGLAALAAARSGAAGVLASDIDPLAMMALRLNAAANGLAVDTTTADLVGQALDGIDVVLAGDVCYEKPMAARVTGWLRVLAAAGKTVLLADPGRTYLPQGGLDPLARFTVPTTLELEDRDRRDTVVWQVRP
ncbi:MAG: methyltransferase [Rhodospirillaceae bacterium]|nr:methyltransferase [Rhodospirillaceae bacterium]